MSKILIQEATVKQVLEYVESVPDDRYNAEHINQEALVTALRQAIEQAEQAQPVEDEIRRIVSSYVDSPMLIEELCHAIKQAEQATVEQCQPEQAQPVADRDAFERHWKKVRGEKKSDRELKRHPLQPQTYVQDSANRHWVTWQAATRKASPPPRQPWVGLTDQEFQWIYDNGRTPAGMIEKAEAKLKEKNT